MNMYSLSFNAWPHSVSETQVYRDFSELHQVINCTGSLWDILQAFSHLCVVIDVLQNLDGKVQNLEINQRKLFYFNLYSD